MNWFCIPLSVSAQTNQPNGQYFQDWLLAGPFDTPVFNDRLPEKIPQDSIFHPEAGQKLSPKISWQRFHSDSSVVNLTNYFQKNKRCYAYAHCMIEAPEDGSYRFFLGQDDKISVWVNETQYLYINYTQSLILDKNVFECHLNAGLNTLLIKSGQNLGYWSFAIRVEPAKNLSPSTPPLIIGSETLPLDIGSENWRRKKGDNPEWAKPDYDDSAWLLSAASKLPASHEKPPPDKDIYWLRFKTVFHPNTHNQPLMLSMPPGDIQVYQDGVALPRIQIQIPFSFNFPGYQTLNNWLLHPRLDLAPSVIAIRSHYNNCYLLFSDLLSYQYEFFEYSQLNTIIFTLFASAGFCLIIFHLSIYFFYSEEKYNLVYVLYLLSLILYILVNLQYTNHYIYYPVSSPLFFCKFFSIWPNLSLQLALFYKLFNKPWPKYSYLIVGFIGITCYIDWMNNDNTTILWILILVILFVETIHIFINQTSRNHLGITILWIGIGLLLTSGIVSISQMDSRYYYNNFLLDNGYWFGMLGFTICISVYGAFRYTFITKKFLELTVSLEEKIQERTLALEKTNTQLQKEISIRKQKEAELEELSFQDSLTGIANRRHFDLKFEEEWKRAQREKIWLSLILGDVDFFKNYNDSYGHQAGDDCLRMVAKTLQSTVKRPGDFAARYGGEEFAVLLIGTDSPNAATIAESMRKKVEQLHIEHKKSAVHPYVTISLGVASMIPHSESNQTQLILSADKALYEAKQQGRNRVIVEFMEN